MKIVGFFTVIALILSALFLVQDSTQRIILVMIALGILIKMAES